VVNKDSRRLITKKGTPLPGIFEQYLVYQEQSLQASYNHIRQVRRILTDFHLYLSRENITLPNLNIERVDNFMAGYKVSQSTRRIYRYFVKGFLKYLYHEKRVIKRDLAQVLVGPPIFAQSRLPRFLRPQQVRKLFESLPLSTPTEIRTYTMIHLAYSLGLRPAEISKLTLDDISFSKWEITIRERKNNKPVIMPIPKESVKTLAIYIGKGRPKGLSRHIFLLHHYPYRPVSSHMVGLTISTAMKKAGLPSTAYWLRHTYAQNLLSIGRSIYEVKEMLGHNNIQSTKRYLHINTELMRKVIFDEEL
jgi:site-specific recombinase XerD